MTDQEIKDLLTSYVGAEMALIDAEVPTEQDYRYSKSYNKRIRRMFWSEKYFGSRLRLGYMVRRAAVVAIIILGLCVTNEVSARVFGFSPWEFVTSFLTDSKMDVKTYVKPEGQPHQPVETALPAITRDVPVLIPEGFEQTTFYQENSLILIEWHKTKKESLQYTRNSLSTGMSIATDGEYQSREKITVLDYAGNCCVKGDKIWITWEDASYQHMITAAGVENPKEALINMAESLYT